MRHRWKMRYDGFYWPNQSFPANRPGDSVAFNTLNSTTRRLVVPRRKDGVANDARYYHIGMFLEQADDDEADNPGSW